MTARSKQRKAKAVRLMEAQKGKCAYCFQPIETYGGTDLESGTLDHVVPESKGGAFTITNLLLMHRRCNEKKDTRPYRNPDFHQGVLRRLAEMPSARTRTTDGSGSPQ